MKVVKLARWARQVGTIITGVAELAAVGLVINGTVVQPSMAQTAGLPPPEFSLKDENNVDLLSFSVYLEQTDLSIGSNERPLTHSIFSYAHGQWLASNDTGALSFFDKDSFTAAIYFGSVNGPCGQQPVYSTVAIGSSRETIACLPDRSFVAAGPTGSTLTYNNGNNRYTYTKRDGETIQFDISTAYRATQILYPDGRVLKWWYYDDGTGAPILKSVTRSDGLQLKYSYSKLASGLWSQTSVTAINNAYEYCNPTASTCSLKMAWPTVNYSFTQSTSNAVFTVTDAAGRVTRYTEDVPPGYGFPARTVGIKLPSSASADNITYAYCGNNNNWCSSFGSVGWSDIYYKNYVLAVTRDGQTWNYAGTPGSPSSSQCGNATYGFTNPVGSGKRVHLQDCPAMGTSPSPGNSTLLQLTDEDGVQFNPYPNGVQIKNAINPEGNQTNYSWDAGTTGSPVGRGNLIQKTIVPKSGSPLAQVNLYANYDTTCTNQVTCNKPNWVKDGLGNQTDYKYDPTHGGVLTATLPADANGVRPQTRYTYTQRYAWALNASGAYVQSAAPIWVLATESNCRTSAASPTGIGCTVASDEVVKTYEYGPNSGPNNLFLRGMSVSADGVTHRTCYGYDPLGNKISETEAAAGLTSCP